MRIHDSCFVHLLSLRNRDNDLLFDQGLVFDVCLERRWKSDAGRFKNGKCNQVQGLLGEMLAGKGSVKTQVKIVRMSMCVSQQTPMLGSNYVLLRHTMYYFAASYRKNQDVFNNDKLGEKTHLSSHNDLSVT